MKRKISIVLTLALVIALSLSGTASGATAGTYTAEATGYGGTVSVTIEVDDEGKILSGEANASSETPELGGAAAPQIMQAIIEQQSLAVDTVSGATMTSRAVIAAVEAALAQAGVDTGAMKPEAAPGEDEEVTVDVAIVGAGASGSTAALAAIEKGLSVLMVERTGGIGGVSKYWAGGGFAVGTKIQEEAGYNIDKDDALRTMIDYSHFISYAPLQKAIIYRSANTIEWMQGYGVEFAANPASPQIAHQDDPMKWQNYHWYVNFGQEVAALDIVHEKLAEMGLDLRLNTTATKLLTDESGAVVGYEAEKADGGKLTVHAKAVVLGTGGFGSNYEMIKEYFHTDRIIGMGENYGDGQKMAWEVGAAKWDIQSALLHGAGMVAGPNPGEINLGSSPFNQIVRSPLMWVDLSGNRFCNEEAVYDTAYHSNVGYSVGGTFYILLDTATLNAYTEGKPLVMDPAVGGPNMDPADFVELAEEGVRQGNIFKGETLAELAANTGMDPEKLQLNVDEYNACIDNGYDFYGKDASNLVYKVAEGPFYAVKMIITNLGTTGGVRVDEKMRACDENLKPIPGLFVVGNDAAGYYGNTTAYPPYEGLATGFAITSGHLGGDSAAEYVQALQ